MKVAKKWSLDLIRTNVEKWREKVDYMTKLASDTSSIPNLAPVGVQRKE